MLYLIINFLKNSPISIYGIIGCQLYFFLISIANLYQILIAFCICAV